MNIRLCFNATHLTDYAVMDLGDGTTAVDRAVRYAQELSPNDGVTVFVSGERRLNLPETWNVIQRETWSEQALLEQMSSVSGQADTVIYAPLDAPFLSNEITSRMLELHSRYRAEYTFADGYPAGMSPELFASSIFGALADLARRDDAPPVREGLFRVVQRDINAFDVETELSRVDLRLLRLSLWCDTRRNYLLCVRLAKQCGSDTGCILDQAGRQEVLRTLPAYVSVELVEGDSQDVIYDAWRHGSKAGTAWTVPPLGTAGREMDVSRFSELVAAIEKFAPSSMLHISLRGEIGLHSAAAELIRTALGHDLLDTVVETSGVGWKDDDLSALTEAGFEPARWIIDLDASDETVYQSVRGNGFREAMNFTESLMSAHPSRVYVQAVRMAQTEEHLEQFYRFWKERTENVIIQKYDHSCGRLADRRVTDISPVKRFPCWHLKRDLSILLDGSVVMCREDLERAHAAGNVFSDGIESVWERLEPLYQAHVREEYPALCRNCDEYYTYNY